MIAVGIEHEFVFKNDGGFYLDFTNCDGVIFSEIVERFPYFEGDHMTLDCKSTEKRPKRCYVEGFDRYNLAGELIATIPKGLEIRTLPHGRLDDLLAEFLNSFRLMRAIVGDYGYSPVLISHHPFLTDCVLGEKLNNVELGKRSPEGLKRALLSNLTHGLHINISVDGFGATDLANLAKKYNYYLPGIVPYTFSSPFYDSKLSQVLSMRIYGRAAARPFVEILDRKGTATIQIRAFDSCGDPRLLRGICLLIKGLAQDTALPGREEVQDSDAIKRACRHGFSDPDIRVRSEQVLDRVSDLYPDEHDALGALHAILRSNHFYANRIIDRYGQGNSIIESVSELYEYQ
jgi:hypothetical protein